MHGGQLVASVPEKPLVVVQTVDVSSNGQGIGMRDFFTLMRLIYVAAP